MEEVRDFKDTPYYEYYSKRIDEYWIQLIRSVMDSQWIDTDKKFSRADVLKEVYKFVNGELREFKDELDMNPNAERVQKAVEDELIKNQAKQLLGMN